jgi:hypothetical protein
VGRDGRWVSQALITTQVGLVVASRDCSAFRVCAFCWLNGPYTSTGTENGSRMKTWREEIQQGDKQIEVNRRRRLTVFFCYSNFFIVTTCWKDRVTVDRPQAVSALDMDRNSLQDA